MLVNLDPPLRTVEQTHHANVQLQRRLHDQTQQEAGAHAHKKAVAEREQELLDSDDSNKLRRPSIPGRKSISRSP